MPGILPMKVIKMGSNANMRVAQACDRCRSKKIRCDGIRPCCTQCASVGFECKTSDKLSRRAFPRGYTESLEERVRNLESEVKELKDLLDEKDEKIELLTRVYPYRQTSPAHLPSPKASVSSPSATSKSDPAEPADVTFKVEQSSNLACHGDAESYFAGTSSGTSFLEAFKQRAQEKSRSTNDVKPAVLLRSAAKHTQIPIGHTLSPLQSRPPPRLMTDQYINIFFQEWAPLFPVLHRPTFLESYESFTASPEAVTDRKSIAQLYLVFSLAVLSQNNPQSDTSALEVQWQAALQHVLSEQSLSVLQCLLLAQLFCMQKGDCRQMLTYKALAVSLSVRLGLHQSQKRFALGALTCETRKKVFWTLYTLDSFSAVVLGLPRQIKDDEVFCEYPADVDDEYVSDKGFQPPLPGESTRVSSALALFRAARILSKVVDQVYPALPSYELSRNQLSALSDELDQWQASLAPHLRLPFAQDKPTVGTVSSRSPLLSLTYHYVRFLINRPAACSRSVAASSAMIAMTGSCKHMAQIVALLHERGLSFSFCLNKEELLVISGFGLLLQDLDLDDNSKVLKDDQKTLALIIGQLDRMKVPVASSFRHIACSFLPGATRNPASDSPSSTSPQRQAPEFAVPAPQSCNISSSFKQQFKAMTQKFGWSGKAIDIAGLQRRMTSAGPYNHSLHAHSVPTLPQTEALPTRVPKSEPAGSPPHPRLRPLQSQRIPASAPQHETLQQPRASLNLDFLSFGNGGGTQMPETSGKTTNQSDWERLLAGLDNGQTNIFDNIYGGPPMEVLREPRKPQAPATVYSMQSNSMGNLPVDALAWDPEIWAATTADMSPLQMAPTLTESVASLSSNDESKESGNGNALGLGEVVDMDELERYGSLVMPDIAQNDDGTWDGRMGGALVHA